jgi:hypothetical protein
MPSPRRLLAAFSTPLLYSVVAGVSLDDFTPRNTGLTADCESAYDQVIPGCIASDFTNGNPNSCSRTCVNGLLNIQRLIQSQCADVIVDDRSLVGLFKLGSGIPILCPNFKVETATLGAPSSTASVITESVIGADTSSTSSAGVQSRTTAGTVATTAPPAPPVHATADASDVFVDPTARASQTASFVYQTKPTATGKSSAKTQKSNKDSGGGSPFDIQATSGDVELLRPTLISLLGALVALTIAI